MVRKAFKAGRIRAARRDPGGCAGDLAPRPVSAEPLPVRQPKDAAPSTEQVARAVDLLTGRKAPVVLVGAGASRDRCTGALLRFAEL